MSELKRIRRLLNVEPASQLSGEGLSKILADLDRLVEAGNAVADVARHDGWCDVDLCDCEVTAALDGWREATKL